MNTISTQRTAREQIAAITREAKRHEGSGQMVTHALTSCDYCNTTAAPAPTHAPHCEARRDAARFRGYQADAESRIREAADNSRFVTVRRHAQFILAHELFS